MPAGELIALTNKSNACEMRQFPRVMRLLTSILTHCYAKSLNFRRLNGGMEVALFMVERPTRTRQADPVYPETDPNQKPKSTRQQHELQDV